MHRLSTPHCHTQFCDGRSSAEEMVESALQHGFVSLGFSSHARQNFDLCYAMDADREAAYLHEIKRLQSKYKGRIRIWLGMERDCFSQASRDGFDFVIGAAHYLPQADGRYAAVDGPVDTVRALFQASKQGQGLEVAKAYYRLLGQYICDFKPDIIAHFDLVCKHNKDKSLFDDDSPGYIKAATEAMDLAITGCDLMEINTGAMKRQNLSFPYPKKQLLAYWKALGGQVILASDCHHAPDIATHYEEAHRLIKSLGYKKAAVLGRRDELFEWVDL